MLSALGVFCASAPRYAGPPVLSLSSLASTDSETVTTSAGLPALADRLRARHQVGVLARLDQPRDVAPQPPVIVAVEVLAGDEVRHPVERLVVEQQRPEQRLLGLDRMRRDFQRQELRVGVFRARVRNLLR